MTENWSDVRAKFKNGIFAFTFFFGFSFISSPVYLKEDLNKQNVLLRNDPQFRKESTGDGTNYWVELNIWGEPAPYIISGIDYKRLKHEELKNYVHALDSVTIYTDNKKVLILSTNSMEFTRFEDAQYHKSKNRLFVRYLSLIGLSLCILPLLFKKRPFFSISGQKIRVRFDLYLLLGLIIGFIILSANIGFEFISGKQFVDTP